MNHHAFTACTALALAASANAGLVTWDLTGSGTAAGALASLGTVSIRLTMTFDDSASSLSATSAIANWGLQVSDSYGADLYVASGAASAGPSSATYTRWTSGGVSTRRYTVMLGGTTSSAWQGAASGMGLPSITLSQFGFVAARNAYGYGTLAESLTQSATTGEGFLMLVANGSPTSFGTIGSTFVIPAPGAATLLATAGLVSLRRRRA